MTYEIHITDYIAKDNYDDYPISPCDGRNKADCADNYILLNT